MKIVIAVRKEFDATKLINVVQKMGHDPILVHNWFNALREVRGIKPQITIFEQLLPDCDGIQLALLLKHDSVFKNMKIAVLFGTGDEETIEALKTHDVKTLVLDQNFSDRLKDFLKN